ncbi:MAG: ParA family protein [Betaproteobacteria bacterium]|nr:MAG: ParA family protein [Betaproteobacteria bacterium]
MPTIAIVSRKGGSGKSTLATNLAAYFALQGISVTLGDLDHQQSMRAWLKRRPSAAPVINAWVGNASGAARPPPGTTNLVLDTPGGLHGLELAKVAMIADAILIPVSGSLFDRESASDCWAELRQHPRVKSGRCAVATIGMRLDARTHAKEVTQDWAASVQLEFIACLRSTQLYVRAVENGLSIFDMPLSVTEADREQWRPIVAWLGERVFASAASAPAVLLRDQGTVPRLPVRPAILQPVVKSKSDIESTAPSSGLGRFIPSIFRRKTARTEP